MEKTGNQNALIIPLEQQGTFTTTSVLDKLRLLPPLKTLLICGSQSRCCRYLLAAPYSLHLGNLCAWVMRVTSATSCKALALCTQTPVFQGERACTQIKGGRSAMGQDAGHAQREVVCCACSHPMSSTANTDFSL